MTSRAKSKNEPADDRRATAELTVHADCSLVPEMPAEQYRAFRADIERRGIHLRIAYAIHRTGLNRTAPCDVPD